MAKTLADYYITGIWKEDGNITHVMLHRVDPNLGRLIRGEKTTEAAAIALLELGNTMRTAAWNYNKAQFVGKADVIVVDAVIKFLRTSPDDTASDNLSNMLDMRFFIP